MKILNLILAIIMFALPLALIGENGTNYIEGKVTKKNGEVIEGKIEKKDVVSASNEVVIIDQNGNEHKFKPNDVKGYSAGDRSYRSHTFRDFIFSKNVFVRQVNNSNEYFYFYYYNPGKNRPVKKHDLDLQKGEYVSRFPGQAVGQKVFNLQ